MAAAIAASSAPASPAPATGSTGAAGLQAQLARYQKQLADCVDCASAKTPEGKKNIQQLSDKISTAKERLREIEANRTARQPQVGGAGENRESGRGSAAGATAAASAGTAPQQPGAIYSTLGSVLDVFA